MYCYVLRVEKLIAGVLEMSCMYILRGAVVQRQAFTEKQTP